MKRGFIFGCGAFVCSLVYWEVLFLVRNGHIAFTWPPLSSFFLFLVSGWVFYSLGAIVFKRNSTLLIAFILGVVAELVAEVSIAYFIAHTKLPRSHEALVNSSWSALLGGLAQLFLPFVVCSFLAPLIGQRNTKYLLR